MNNLPLEQKIIGGICGVILLLLMHRAFLWEPNVPPPPPPKDCEGRPLYVEYAYESGNKDPHACAIQCEDDIQRYLVYSDGFATQCEMLPGCLDWGEDRGVTCTIK